MSPPWLPGHPPPTSPLPREAVIRQLAPQCGVPHTSFQPSSPFCFGIVLFGVCDKDLEELASLAILSFAVYVSN